MPPKSDTRAMNVRLCAFGVFLLLLGIAGYCGIQLAESRIEATSRWPKVSGRVVTSEVTTAVIKTGRVRQASDVANVRYTYSVEGQEYESDGERVVPMLHTKPTGTPEEIVDRYPVGSTVDVYYDPNDPSDALLIPVPAEDATRLISGLAFLAPCVALGGLLFAGIAAFNLSNNSRRQLSPPPAPEISARYAERGADPRGTVKQPAAAMEAMARPRATHWLVRTVAVLIGLFLMLFGGPMTVVMAGTSDPRVGTAVRVISLTMVGGAMLLGAVLVWRGMRHPRRSASTKRRESTLAAT